MNRTSRTGGTALTDAQIAGITEFVNTAEIEQAELAKSKSNNPQVLNFAVMMISHHSQAKQKQASLGLTTASSPVLQTLSTEGQKTTTTLRDKTGSDFDRAYLQAQVEQHQKVLDTLNMQLLPNAKNAQLRSQLESMRSTVQQHLQAARDAQTSLNKGGRSESGASSQ